MADVKWIKITTDIFDDEKILLIESLPDAYAIITCWFKLLCLAGKMNNSGVFMMNNSIAYTDKMLSTIFRMKESIVQMALRTFEEFGMVEIINGVITIPNWNKHQSLDAYEQKKERDRIYQAERRRKQRLIAEQSSDTSSDESVDKSSYVAKNRSIDKEEDIDIDKDKEKDNNTKASPLSILVPEVREAMESFMKMRKKIKKPMSDNAVQRMINKLHSLSNDYREQVEILHQSEDNCWLDVYPLKQAKSSSQAQQGDNIFLQIAQEEGLFQ